MWNILEYQENISCANKRNRERILNMHEVSTAFWESHLYLVGRSFAEVKYGEMECVCLYMDGKILQTKQWKNDTETRGEKLFLEIYGNFYEIGMRNLGYETKRSFCRFKNPFNSKYMGAVVVQWQKIFYTILYCIFEWPDDRANKSSFFFHTKNNKKESPPAKT